MVGLPWRGRRDPTMTSPRARTDAPSSSNLDDWVDELAAIGAGTAGINRFAWSPALMAASNWLVDRLGELGLDAEIDAAGNVVGRWSAGEGPAVVVGSHLDTVPEGGRFDGALGVLSGLEAIRRLKAEHWSPLRPLWLVAFNDEEGTRFGTSLFGSSAFVGDDLTALREREGIDGATLAEAMRSSGFDFEDLAQARAVDKVGCYVELHIEQGNRLEAQELDAAVVTAIVGVRGYRVELHGEVNHAGTTPMNARHDALAGAARAVLALRHRAVAAGDVTANVGRIDVSPGGSNVVPGTAVFTVDIRSADQERYAELDSLVRSCVAAAASDEGLTAEIVLTHEHPPTAMSDELQRVLGERMNAAGLRWAAMSSGAAHDAQLLAAHVPAGMLFVPSQGGISHSPMEFTTSQKRERGVAVLTDVLRTLCSEEGLPCRSVDGPSSHG